MGNTDKKQKIAAVLSLATGVGLVLFWLGFFFGGLAPKEPPPCYFAYEHSFPLPDIIMAVFLMWGGFLLLKEKALGKKVLLCSSGGLIFLGVLDFSFNIQNGVYAMSVDELISNAFINIWCVVFGLWMARTVAGQLK